MLALDKVQDIKRHIWLTTSGTSGSLKWVGLSKEAVLKSAGAVNRHLESDSKDIWLHALPPFHVGGLGIAARSHLSGARVVTMQGKWDPIEFHRALSEEKATLSALVPAQVHDLVMKDLRAPLSMHGIIVGGGALGECLYKQAVAMGWPLLPSYGMSECCSQVATARKGNSVSGLPVLELLDHIEAKTDNESRLWIKSSALLSVYIYKRNDSFVVIDPKEEGWFKTEDLGEVKDRKLMVFGRMGDFFKIGGESVDFLRLEKILNEIRLNLHVKEDMALVPIPDPRLGYVIHLAVQGACEHTDQVLACFQARVFPFEKIRQVHQMFRIPRTPLNKLLKQELIAQIIQKS